MRQPPRRCLIGRHEVEGESPSLGLETSIRDLAAPYKTLSNERLCSPSQEVVKYAIKQDFTAPIGYTAPSLAFLTARAGAYNTEQDFLTARDSAYDTKRDFLPRKIVRTAPRVTFLQHQKGSSSRLKWKYHLEIERERTLTPNRNGTLSVRIGAKARLVSMPIELAKATTIPGSLCAWVVQILENLETRKGRLVSRLAAFQR